MSIKTLRKRIALVAVSALGAGLFSVVATPVANAGTADVTANTLWLATTNSATVNPVVTALGGDTSLDKSKGYLAVTSADSASQVIQANGTGLAGGASGTAVALNTAKLVFNAAGGAATDRVSIVATNGTVSGVTSARVSIATIATNNATDIVTVTTTGAHGLSVGDVINIDAQLAIADSTAAVILTVANATTFTYNNGAGVNADTAAQADNGNFTVALNYNGSATAAVRYNGQNPVIAAVVTPNAGATTMTVSAYKGTAITEAAPSTGGTLLGTWSITLASAAATNTYSPSLSLLALATSTAAQITTNVDASTSNISAGNPYYIQVIGKNPYNQALAGGTYVATATNGALLNWGDSAGGAVIAAGTLSVATKTPDGTDQLRIDPASSLTTSTTTVTITHDGTVIATKNLTFYGEAKKIVIEKVVPGTITTAIAGNGATAYAIYSYRDSADGKVPGAAATFVASSATSTVSTGGSARNPSRSSTAAAGNPLLAAVATLVGPGGDGVFAFTCGSTPGKASPSITHTNAITGATLTAEVKDLGCYGPIATYTVSMDKASYAVGDIATITIEGKDAAGNPVSDAQLLGAGTISVGGGDLTVAVGATDVFTAGKATYKAQIKTAGKFNTVVSIAGSVTKSATTSYTVTDGAISNAEVLASIVKLIAAINKQIRALQKSLKR